MKRQIATRTAIALLIGAALFWGYNLLRDVQDIDLGTITSTDWIVAVEELENGSQIVLFDADRNERVVPGAADEFDDREPVWGKAGDRIFFVSNREDDGVFHIFRWNPARDEVRRRTLDSRSKSAPFFGSSELTGTEDLGLITAGGRVLEFDHRAATTRQLLPPLARDIDPNAETGRTGQFDMLYDRLGTSFRQAKFGKDRRWVAAVMRRHEGGEILVVQAITPPPADAPVEEAARHMAPRGIVAGDRIDFDVNPLSGDILFTVQGFEFPDPDNPPPFFVDEDGVVQRPFVNLVGFVNPDVPERTDLRFMAGAPGMTIVAAHTEAAFREPAVSPDGTRFVVVGGLRDEDNEVFQAEALVLMDFVEGGGAAAIGLVQGNVSMPSWHPNGDRIVFLKSEGGVRSIYTVSRTGTDERRISDGRRNFLSPSFSPQTRS